MIEYKNTAADYAKMSIVHFFVGLIKADAGLSKAEIEKIKIIIYKMDRGLPVKYPDIKPALEQMASDEDYKLWKPELHLEKAFYFLDRFHAMPAYRKEHLAALWSFMEVVMEVGEITQGEKVYMDRVMQTFRESYGVEIVASVA
ncbi:MAG: hypothetical protein ACK5QE_05195 [Sphingobacteriia bacterium]